MQVNGLDGLQAMVKTESKGKKCFIGISAGVAFVCATVISSIYLAWFANTREIQNAFIDLCETNTCDDDYEDSQLYDIIFVLGPWTDRE